MALLFAFMFFIAPWMPCQAASDTGTSTSYIAVQGAGAIVPLSLFRSAFFSYRFVEPSVQVSFTTSLGNAQTLCRLKNFSKECPAGDTTQPLSIDWVSQTSLLTAGEYQQYPDLQMYPMVASSVMLIYNLKGITNFVLDMQTLAKIWSGRITTWDHPDIKATNPNFTSWNIPANQRITLVSRSTVTAPTLMLRQSLAAVDPVFKAKIGTSADPTWNGVQVVPQNGAQALISYVTFHPYTLGYAVLGDALLNSMPMVKLNRLGIIVEPSTTSVQYALLELGLSFGNNGDDPAHLTGDVYNAVNPLAWPFTSYSYFVVRKSTLRPGATCATVSAMVDFWVWFWNSNDVESLAASLGFAVLPGAVRDFVVQRFQQDMQCGGSLVWQKPKVPVIAGYGPGSAVTIFNKFQQAYSLVNTSVELNYSTLPDQQADISPLLQGGGFVVSTTPLSSSNAINLVLAAEVLVVASQFTLRLDMVTLAKILNGDIKTWLHPDIVALNPKGIRDSSGFAVNDTTQSIVLLQGPSLGSASLTALLQQYYPAYSGAAFQAAQDFSDPAVVWSAVLATPYSLSVLALVDQFPSELLLASIVSGGTAVVPSVTTAKACAASMSYDTTTKSLAFPFTNGSCYPLLLPLYIAMERQCPTTSPAIARAVAFLDWMFKDTTLSATLNTLNLVSLTDLSTSIHSDNEEALFQLSCGVHPVPATTTDIVPLLLAIIIPIVLVVLIGVVACGWWLWRVTENNRMLRKKFSNDNVAESCAEAIARFDLAAVEWLKEVKEPNKIQLAFLAIVSLLTEVKPYIPDQLLSGLTANKNSAVAENDTDHQSITSTPVARGSIRRYSNQQEPRKLSPRVSRWSEPPSPSSTSVRGRRAHESIASSEGARQVLAMKDWHRKRCTYMCVRFGSTFPQADRRLPALVQVAGRVVDIAKANGATIDAVGVDAVNVHWGVASSSGVSAARAVQAGLEMALLRDTLPEDQRAAFWLQIGIGKGLCDCGTVSSESGHRFFVVWGPEASLAIRVATANLPKKVLTTMLVSPAVYQEVQYTVLCMPRLWYGDVLLWEPQCVLKKEDDDEWMYELQKMNEGTSLSNTTLLEAFQLAKNKGVTATELSAHVAELRSLHGSGMSLQDMASLDLLQSMARAHNWEMVIDDANP